MLHLKPYKCLDCQTSYRPLVSAKIQNWMFKNTTLFPLGTHTHNQSPTSTYLAPQPPTSTIQSIGVNYLLKFKTVPQKIYLKIENSGCLFTRALLLTGAERSCLGTFDKTRPSRFALKYKIQETERKFWIRSSSAACAVVHSALPGNQRTINVGLGVKGTQSHQTPSNFCFCSTTEVTSLAFLSSTPNLWRNTSSRHFLKSITGEVDKVTSDFLETNCCPRHWSLPTNNLQIIIYYTCFHCGLFAQWASAPALVA